MHFSQLQLIILVLIFLPNISFSQQNKHEIIQQFSVKPLICITTKKNEPCKMTITVNWQATQPINACLFQENKSLFCWKKQKKISEKINIELSNDIRFKLLNDKAQVYAQQNVVINTVAPRSFRRRLRAEWSLF